MESKKGGEHGNMEEIKPEGKQEKQPPESYKKLVKMIVHGYNLLDLYYNEKKKKHKQKNKKSNKKDKTEEIKNEIDNGDSSKNLVEEKKDNKLNNGGIDKNKNENNNDHLIANEQNKNEINNTNPDINPIKNTSNQININNNEKNKIKIDNQINIKKNESKEMKNDNNDDDNNINHIEGIDNQASKNEKNKVFNHDGNDQEKIIDAEKQIQKQLNDLLHEKDLRDYIRFTINGYNTTKTGYTVSDIQGAEYSLLKKFIRQSSYKDKYDSLLKEKTFSALLKTTAIPKDLADLILLAWSCNRKGRIQLSDVGPYSWNKSFPCLKQLYHDDVSPTGMVYFLSAFVENSLALDKVNQVLSAQKNHHKVIDGKMDNWPEYQPTEKTFTIVLKAIESLSGNCKLTRDFMDIICKTLDFKALNDKLNFDDISEIEDKVLSEIDCFYGVVYNMITHNRLDNKNGEQILEESYFYNIFNMNEDKGNLVNFWKKINSVSQDPKDNSFYNLLQTDVINKLAKNEKNDYAVKLKKLVGNGSILKSLGVEIKEETNGIDKIGKGSVKDTNEYDPKITLGLTQTNSKKKVLIWENLILILLIGLAALASVLSGLNIKFLFIVFITNPLSIIITVVAVALFFGLTYYANKVKAIRLSKLYCGKESQGKSFFNVYGYVDSEIPNQGRKTIISIRD